MSAYDMLFSDAIYGPCDRYVSRQRMQTMLAHEYDLLIERLDAKRGATTNFFVFADTVTARSFKGGNECHGWLGIRFQSSPHTEANDVIIHVRMLDKENLQQQEALGIIGVNLVYGAFYYASNPYVLVESLLDGLTTQRIEVDMIKLSGPAYKNFDSRLASLHLVTTQLTDAVMFAPEGEVLQPSEALYKKAILLERGSFRPITKVNVEMLERARTQFLTEPKNKDQKIMEILEITMNNLLSGGDQVDPVDFLQRVDVMGTLDKTVMISSFGEFHRLGAFLNRYTKNMIGLVLGVPLLQEMFDPKYYSNLEGGILEAFGRLFKNDLKLYAYPGRSLTDPVLSIETMVVAPHLLNLFQHLTTNGFIQSVHLTQKDTEFVGVTSRDVANKILAGDLDWEKNVLPRVARIIKERGYFGYKEPRKPEDSMANGAD